MIQRRLFIGVLLLATTVFSQQKIVGYLTGYGEEPTASQIQSMTHVMFCFITPVGTTGDIKCSYGEERMKRVVAAAKLFDVKTLISFGGGGVVLSGELITNETNRQRFVSNLVSFVETYDLDGIDNDWEPDFSNYGPLESDEAIRYQNNVIMREYYNTMVSEIRDSLDARFGSKKKLLTAAIGATNGVWYSHSTFAKDKVCWPDGFWDDMDFVNLMTYGSGAGGLQHGDRDIIFGSSGGVSFWTDRGMDKEKIIAGVPFYASADWSVQTGYREIVTAFPDIDTTIDTVRADFGSGKRLYGFTGVHSMKLRVSEAISSGIGGIMFWELNNDLPIEHPLSLLRAINPPPTNPVTVVKAIDTVRTSSALFSSKIILTEYFTNESGSLTFSLSSTPNRHHFSISGDTLKIIGDSLDNVGITSVVIRASNALSAKEYQLAPVTVVVESRTPLTRIVSDSGSNLVKTGMWKVQTYNAPLVLPVDSTQLFTQLLGDTVISLVGGLRNIANWNSVTLPVPLESQLDFTKERVILTYQVETDNPSADQAILFTNNANEYACYFLKSTSGEWRTDTITASKLVPGWQQPTKIDLSTIKSAIFEFGSQSNSAIISFSLKEFEISADPLPTATYVLQKTAITVVQLRNNQILLSGSVSRSHRIELFSVRGQKLWSGSVIAGISNPAIDIPAISSGAYLLKISGSDVIRTQIVIQP